MIAISCIVPVYNEERAIREVLLGLRGFLETQNIDYEIIAVNDGSTDGTKEIVEKIDGIRLINHSNNKGYGASLKSGARHARFEWLIFFDGDGQHRPEYILDCLKKADGHEMIIGSRQGFKGPLLRQPGKKILTWIAQYLVGQKIPDINSGFRMVNKICFQQFLHILPNGFSASTTSTLAFLGEGLNVKYIPIEINKRIGKSTVKQVRHGVETILLILRVIMIFNPLKIFFPISLFFIVSAIGFLVWDMIVFNMSETTVVLFMTGIFIFCVGLLADQIASLRRERR